MLLAFVSFGCYESKRRNKKKQRENIVLQQKFPFFCCTLSSFISELPAIILTQRHSSALCRVRKACFAINCAFERSWARADDLSYLSSFQAVSLSAAGRMLYSSRFVFIITIIVVAIIAFLNFLYLHSLWQSLCCVCVPHRTKRKTNCMPNCPAFSFPQSFKYANTKIQNYILCGCRCCLLNTYIDDIALCASSLW